MGNGRRTRTRRRTCTRRRWVATNTSGWNIPIYLYPFGHKATLVTITERKIDPKATNPAANLKQRSFIVLREQTRDYGDVKVKGHQVPELEGHPVLNAFPFTTITIEPMVSTDIVTPVPNPPKAPFVPFGGADPYPWKITGVDHERRTISMVTPLVAVPIPDPNGPPIDPPPHNGALKTWNEQVVAKHYPLNLGGVDIAFAPSSTSGDTTSRVQHIEFTGYAEKETSAPELRQASVVIPALAALNRGGGTSLVKYGNAYVKSGFKPGDLAQLYLQLTESHHAELRRRQRSRRRFRRAQRRGESTVAEPWERSAMTAQALTVSPRASSTRRSSSKARCQSCSASSSCRTSLATVWPMVFSTRRPS